MNMNFHQPKPPAQVGPVSADTNADYCLMAVREPTACSRSFPHGRIRKMLSDGGRLVKIPTRDLSRAVPLAVDQLQENGRVGSSTPALAVGLRFLPSTRARNWGRARPSPGPSIPCHLRRVGTARPRSWHARFPRGRSLARAWPPASRVGQGPWRPGGRSDGPCRCRRGGTFCVGFAPELVGSSGPRKRGTREGPLFRVFLKALPYF